MCGYRITLLTSDAARTTLCPSFGQQQGVRVKIDIIGPTYPYRGGIAHYTTLLVKHLQDAGHAVKLYSYTRQYPQFLFPGKSDRDPSATALRVPAEYIVDPINPLTWLRVFNRVRRDRPDMLILQWWVPYWTPSLAVISHLVKHYSRVKIVYVCHNVTPHEESGTLDHRLAWVVLKRGDAFIVHSEQDRRKLTAILPRPPVWLTHLPTFTDFEQFKPSGDVLPLRQQLGLDGKRVLLFFGFVRPYKGLQYLIQALPLVRQQIPDIHLLIVGEFWSSKWEYIAYVENAGVADAVTIVDHYIPNEEVKAYFECADVTVLPYVSATQSGNLQLAFGFGTPVITTRVGGLYEVVRDGYNGIVVPPQNEEALAEAIVRFYQQDLSARLRANIAAERDAGRFDWGEMVGVLEQIERRLAGKGKPE
jgi:glycosyltransferase involved in cell wall biosynthesis